MKRLILMAALSAIVFAKPKPETYKETEDFQYSRSSSDDGTKSGYYGAQRGNMGGNYERAHNMDTLAQHQLSGVVRQVDGELGEGAKTRTGSVYTAANSRGIYGSGQYDLSNLQGRNFAEGETRGNSQSHSSLSSHNSRYGGHLYSGMESSSRNLQDSRYSGYQTSRHADQIQTDNLQAVDTSQGLGRYESNNQAGYNTNYQTQYGSRGRSEFDQSSANLHTSSGFDANSQAHYLTTPVKVVLRPGGRVAIPITAPTYAVSQNALSQNNAINSDAELINQQAGSSPTNKVKHYEASYSYRKQWEKHHSLPGDASIFVPTENPYPKNSELYEDAEHLQLAKNQLLNANSQSLHSSSMNSDQRAYAQSASSRSRFQTGYNSEHSQSGYDSQQLQGGFNTQQRQSGSSSLQSQSGLSSHRSHSALDEQQSHLGFNSQQSSASAATRANTYGRRVQNSHVAADLINAAGDINSKPKSYQSSYSYHKSWERQGDPYVIKPAGPIYDGQASERLTAASASNAAYSSSRQYGSHSRQAHQSYSADCDDEGHIRVARSYNTDQELQHGQSQWEDLGQQTETKFENLEDLGQQTENKFDNLENLGQQQQNKWDNLQDLGQQTQDKWDNLQQLGQETQNQWGNLQQLGQQTQNQWDNLQQLGQQTQGKWDNLEDLGQQTHRDLDQHQNENLEDFNQKQDAVSSFDQQANSENENLDIFSQHLQKENPLPNFEQQANSENENLDIFSQHLQKENPLPNFEQQTNSENENLDIFSQHLQKEHPLPNFEQQANSENGNLDMFSHQLHKENPLPNFEQQTNSENENLDIFSHHLQKVNPLSNFEQQANNEDVEGISQQTQQDVIRNFEQQTSDQNEDLGILNKQVEKEKPVTNFDQQVNNQNKFSNNQHQTLDFGSQSNILPNVDQQFMSVNIPTNKHDIFQQNQQNEWYQSHLNVDKNTGSYDFMKPISQWPDNSAINSQHHEVESGIHNPFSLPSHNIDYNQFFNENKDQNGYWNTNHKYEHNYWHTNNFDNLNNQFENGFPPASSSLGNSLQGLWSQIDNIGGDVTATEDNKFFLDSNLNKDKNTNVDLAITNIDTESTDKEFGHHNLFDEETDGQSTSTTTLPILLSTDSTTPAQNASTSTDKPVNTDKNTQDEGRGDIGPEEIPFEIETTNKPYKTPQEIETLSLTKVTHAPREGDATTQPNLIKNQNENTGKELFVTNLSQLEESKENKQTNLISIVQPRATTMPTVKISTTTKNKVIFPQPSSQSTIGIIDLSSNPIPDFDKETPHEQVVKNVQIPDDIQQQNLEQQFEDFGQVQSSWLPTSNLQQGYDQINLEQQFEDFQQHENAPDNFHLEDFGQHIQSPIRDVQFKEVAHGNPSQSHDSLSVTHSNNYEQTYQPSPIFKETVVSTPKVLEPKQETHIEEVNAKYPEVEYTKPEIVPPPVEVSTEKPGFWKSVGNKFNSAKNKVYSWFSSGS